MQRAEFEEKDFEGPLNVQLLDGGHILWTPGQVFEFFFGIDSALSVLNPSFWRNVGFSNPLEGVILNDLSLGWLWRAYRGVKRLPPFKTNLFVQVKRPEYLKGVRADYHYYGITGAYYRFHVTSHQQVALEKVARRVKNKALIVYSSPVFHTYLDLYKHIENKTLIDNTSFVRAEKLSGHTKWVYDRPGSIGLGCSEIDFISDLSLREQIKELIVKNSEFNNESLRREDEDRYIRELANEINIVFMELLEAGNPIAKEFFRRRAIFLEQLNSHIDGPLLSFWEVLLFAQLTNLKWYVPFNRAT